MKLHKFAAISLLAVLSAVSLTVSAQVTVGGAPMYANKCERWSGTALM